MPPQLRTLLTTVLPILRTTLATLLNYDQNQTTSGTSSDIGATGILTSPGVGKVQFEPEQP